jgi:hypothetical protein
MILPKDKVRSAQSARKTSSRRVDGRVVGYEP